MTEKVKIVYLNLCDQSVTEIKASSEAAFYPASNLKDPRTTKKWRSTTSSASVVFDMVSREAVDVIGARCDVFNGRGFNSTLTIEANATDYWLSPAYSTTLTFSDKHNIGFKVLTAAQSYRFWRVSGTGSSFLELSNVCLGSQFIPGKNMGTDFKYTTNDLSDRTNSDYGHSFFIEKNERGEAQLNFKFLTKSQVDEFMTMFDSVGTTKPIWIIPDNAEFFSPEKERFASQFYMDKIPTYVHSIKGLYNLSIKVSEVI